MEQIISPVKNGCSWEIPHYKSQKTQYHLENQSEGRKLSGYTLAVARNESVDPPVLKPYPNKIVLKDGQPVNYKRGVYFSINHFKPFTGRIYSDTGFTHLDIMVYNQRGDLLLSRTFEVTN